MTSKRRSSDRNDTPLFQRFDIRSAIDIDPIRKLHDAHSPSQATKMTLYHFLPSLAKSPDFVGRTTCHYAYTLLYTMPHPSGSRQITPPWTIQPVPPQAVNEIIKFINEGRKVMFSGRSLPPDTTSLFSDGSCFLEARDGKDLIAVIGYVRYDNRHPQLDYHAVRTLEIVRLFVQPQYRRCGLAAELFLKLYERAVEEDVECLYLHSHPFLDGAIRFWQKRGFEIVLVDDDPKWQTTHMEMTLKRRERIEGH